MPLTPLSEADTERQRVFRLIQHVVGCKHQVPEFLTLAELTIVLAVLVGEKS